MGATTRCVAAALAAATVLAWSAARPISSSAASPSTGVPILLYHHISTAPKKAASPALYVPGALFRRQMAALAGAGYTAVTLVSIMVAIPPWGIELLRRKGRHLGSRRVPDFAAGTRHTRIAARDRNATRHVLRARSHSALSQQTPPGPHVRRAPYIAAPPATPARIAHGVQHAHASRPSIRHLPPTTAAQTCTHPERAPRPHPRRCTRRPAPARRSPSERGLAVCAP